MRLLEEAQQQQEFITGLIYVNEERPTLPELLHLSDTPLSALPETSLRPSRAALEGIMAGMLSRQDLLPH